jgi:hypothetical protein
VRSISARGRRLIPICLEGANRPVRAELVEALHELARGRFDRCSGQTKSETAIQDSCGFASWRFTPNCLPKSETGTAIPDHARSVPAHGVVNSRWISPTSPDEVAAVAVLRAHRADDRSRSPTDHWLANRRNIKPAAHTARPISSRWQQAQRSLLRLPPSSLLMCQGRFAKPAWG